MKKPRNVLRAVSDELGLTAPKAVKRRRRRAQPAKKRVPTRSFRARGD